MLEGIMITKDNTPILRLNKINLYFEKNIGFNKKKYFHVLKDIDLDINASEIDVANSFIDGYFNGIEYGCKKYNYKSGCITTMYSILNLEKMNLLNSAINDFFKDINDNLDSNYNTIAKIRSKSFQYATNDGDYFEMVDLYEIKRFIFR